MSNIVIVGYVEINGFRTFPDATLSAIYQTLKKEGTMSVVFSAEKISSEMEFIAFMKHPSNYPVMVVVEDKIQGIAWLNGMVGNSAFAHYAFFKESWGKNTIRMAKALMNYWFNMKDENGKGFLDVLVGQTPVWNRKAVRFLEKIGWTVLGEIPYLANGKDMIISYYAREKDGED